MTTQTKSEPGDVHVGQWAHIRYAGHHLVTADSGESHDAIRTACGRTFDRWAIWHDPPKPWLPPCKTCTRVGNAR